uniref:Uncharacterized protein n=1 Tax=Klebsiella phage vB_Kpn2-P1 TaxID=3230848 RepID=A0AAU8EHH2_9VIRU
MEVAIIVLMLAVGIEFFHARKHKLENGELKRTNKALQSAYDNQTRLLHKAQLNLSECKAELESANKIYITKGMV